MLTDIVATVLVAAAIAHPYCPGDCDLDGLVSEAELRTAVSLLFDEAARVRCIAADADSDGAVRAADLIAIAAARASLLLPCGVPAPTSPTPTPTPTPTATTTASFGVESTPGSTWIPLAPLDGGPRQEVGVAALGSSIYVIGGFDEEGRGSARVEHYDIGANDWTTVAPLPQALQHVGAASLGGAVYCVGGFRGSTFVPVGVGYRYDPSAEQWEEVASLPVPRGALALVALDGRLHALGGSSLSGSVRSHTAYDPVDDEWTTLADFPEPGRNHLAAVVAGGRVYVVGGRRDGGGQSNSAELARYDPGIDRWTSLAPMHTARSGHAAAALDGRIVVMGGEVNPANPNGVFAAVEVYDPAKDAWIEIDPMPVPRHGIGAVRIGNRIYVPGGAVFAGFGATAFHDALEIVF